MAFIRKGKTDQPGVARRRRSLDFDSTDSKVLQGEIAAWVESNRPKLGEVMLELGSIDPEELLEALQHQRENPSGRGAVRLGEVLLELGKIDETALAAALAAQFGIPLADLRNETPDQDVIDFVGEDLARKHTVIPLRQVDGRVFLAIADPLDTGAIEELTHHCRRIGLTMGTGSEIERLLDEHYNVLKQAQVHIQAFELTETEDIAQDSGDVFGVDESAPIVQVVNRIITQGVRSRASDIHIEPAENYVRVRYRIDGAMSEAIRLPQRMAPALASRIKVMAELNIVERRRPQDGQFGVTVDGRPIDVRTATAATVHGEKIVLRLLDKTRTLISLKDLGMHPSVEAPYLKTVKAPLGMLLCSGPTGSGKTTTLYATMTEINDPTRNVVTIEDPVEYHFEGISQMPVSDTGMSFADGLRGILRQDPDVILVGEIRDEETARIAMQASLTGHFVLSSLHAVDSVSAVHRFTDMGIEPFLVASSLSAVVGQRLLRRICRSCAAEYVPTPAEIHIVDEAVGHLPTRWLRGTGCNMCSGTGYRGRVGVYEMLQITDPIRELIVSRSTHHQMRDQAIEEGMRTMQQQAFDLVVNGVTTVEDVIRSVYAPGVERSPAQEEAQKELLPGKRALTGATGQGSGPHNAHEPGEASLLSDAPHDPISMGAAPPPPPKRPKDGKGDGKDDRAGKDERDAKRREPQPTGSGTAPFAPPTSGNGAGMPGSFDFDADPAVSPFAARTNSPNTKSPSTKSPSSDTPGADTTQPKHRGARP